MPRLVCLASPEPGRDGSSFELVFNRSVLGRSRWCDVCLPDPAIHRKHAVLVQPSPSRLVIGALHPAAEVCVNGEVLSYPRELAAGDIIELGATRLQVDLADEQAPPAEAASRSGLWGGTLKLSVTTLVSRAVGMLRENLAGAYFGASGAMDAFVVAFQIPNLFRQVLGEYAIEGSLIPVMKSLLARGRAKMAWDAASSALTMMLALVALLMGLCFVGAPWIIQAQAPGLGAKDPALLDLATSLSRIMIPFMALVVLFSFQGALLLTQESFTVYGLAPAVFSVVDIAVMVMMYRKYGVYGLGAGVVAGGLGHVLVQTLALKGSGMRLRPRWRTDDPGTSKVLAMAGPLMLTAAVQRCASLTDRFLASGLQAGCISALRWANLLMMLPFSVLGLSIGRSSFPRLAEKSTHPSLDGFAESLADALRLCLFLLLPTSALMIVLSEPVVTLVHKYGHFDSEAVRLTSVALKYYSLSLVGMSATYILSRAMYALLDTRTPLYTSVLNLVLNVVLNVILVKTALQHAGLALASSIAFTTQMVVLAWLLQQKLKARGRSLPLWALASATGRMLLGTAALCAAAMAAHALCLNGWPGTAYEQDRVGVRIAARLAILVIPSVVGGAAYIAACLLLRVEEVSKLLRLGRKA
jgi:putative peptidoglycan lipid II flippase